MFTVAMATRDAAILVGRHLEREKPVLVSEHLSNSRRVTWQTASRNGREAKPAPSSVWRCSGVTVGAVWGKWNSPSTSTAYSVLPSARTAHPKHSSSQQ